MIVDDQWNPSLAAYAQDLLSGLLDGVLVAGLIPQLQDIRTTPNGRLRQYGEITPFGGAGIEDDVQSPIG